MITFDVKTSFADLITADPEFADSAEKALTSIKTYAAKPNQDAVKAELIIHIPVIFDPDNLIFQTAMSIDTKLQTVKKQKTPLMIYVDPETGELVSQDPSVVRGQMKLI